MLVYQRVNLWITGVVVIVIVPMNLIAIGISMDWFYHVLPMINEGLI